MSVLPANQVQLIVFVLQDALGAEVTGLSTAFTLQISKNGGAFTGSTGTKAEIGSGWYSYELTAAETDTTGPLAIKITHASIDQLNLLYEIRPYSTEEPAGATILTASEAANVLRCLTTDGLMLQLLPIVDDFLEMATGRDWAADTTINPLAKAAAQMLLTMWHENPGMLGGGVSTLNFGLQAALTQLEAEAMLLETEGIPEDKLELETSMPANNASYVAATVSVVLVFSNPMATAATSAVILKTAAGATVTTTNTLDATKRIMTINPSSDLTAAAAYYVDIHYAADIYGQTLYEFVNFTVAP